MKINFSKSPEDLEKIQAMAKASAVKKCNCRKCPNLPYCKEDDLYCKAYHDNVASYNETALEILNAVASNKFANLVKINK